MYGPFINILANSGQFRLEGIDKKRLLAQMDEAHPDDLPSDLFDVGNSGRGGRQLKQIYGTDLMRMILASSTNEPVIRDYTRFSMVCSHDQYPSVEFNIEP